MPAACSQWNLDSLRHAAALAAVASLSIGGCTEKPDNRPPKVSIVSAAPPEARPAHVPRIAAARPPLRTPVQKKARREPKFDPVILVGLDPSAVGRMLGRPAGTRMDAMAMEWTYSAPRCSLNIFFYPDVATGDLKALKYNISGNREGRGCVDFPMMARNDESD